VSIYDRLIKRAFPPRVTIDAVPAEQPEVRDDSWVNVSLGYGTSFDKVQAGDFFPSWILSDQRLSALYYGDAIAAKIVNVVPDQLFRRGYCLKSEANQDQADALQKGLDALGFNRELKSAIRWARLYGGSLILLGVNDGQDLTLPLIPERSTGLQFIQTADRRYATVNRYYDNFSQFVFSVAFEPEIYQVASLVGGVTYFNESRALRFEGEPVDPVKSRELAGWTLSVLQRPYDRLREFMTAVGSTTALLSDASQAVFKLKDLWKQVVGKGVKALQDRMRMVDLTRSSSRSILLDADGESFERVATSFAGLPELLDRYMQFLSATCDIPVSILFGRAAAGMNATGDLDVRMFYDKIASYGDTEITPLILKAISVMNMPIPEDLCVEWLPLWEPSDKEQADTELVEAQTCKTEAEEYAAWIAAGVLFPEEVALAEFSDATNGEVEIDVVARKASLSAEIDLALNPPPAPVPGAPTNGAPPFPPAK